MAKLDVKGIDKFLKALSNSKPKIVVGILGANASAQHAGSDKGITNAQVGAIAEFGTVKSPVRSFLRVPLSNNYFKALKNSGVLNKKSLQEIITQGSIVPLLEKGAVVAEAVVLESFETSGDGNWPPSDMRYKKNHQTLIETRQLVSSITSEVRGVD